MRLPCLVISPHVHPIRLCQYQMLVCYSSPRAIKFMIATTQCCGARMFREFTGTPSWAELGIRKDHPYSALQLLANLRNDVLYPWFFNFLFRVLHSVTNLEYVSASLTEIRSKGQERTGCDKRAIDGF
jgi:hypothetical protein